MQNIAEFRIIGRIGSTEIKEKVATLDVAANYGRKGSVAKIVKLEHAWRRLDGRNDDGFQVAPFPG